MTTRLTTELALLYRVEAAHKIPAAPITRQLIEWEQQRLPDTIPPAPRWVRFKWPANGTVPCTPREKNGPWSPWMKEYL